MAVALFMLCGLCLVAHAAAACNGGTANGIVEAGEACDLGLLNGVGGCLDDCSAGFADVLIVESTSPGGATGHEASAAAAAGLTVAVASDAQFQALTVQQLQGYRALVFGDPTCPGFYAQGAWPPRNTPPSVVPATHNTWSRAIDGHVLIMGGAPADRARLSTSTAWIRYAASGKTGTTGLYLALSCYTPKSLAWLDAAFGGTFDVHTGSYNLAHTTAVHPALDGVSWLSVVAWGTSSTLIFKEWPQDFHVVAVAADGPFLARPVAVSVLTDPHVAPAQPHAPASGAPFVLARGDFVLDGLCGNGAIDAKEQCDDGNNDGGDGCASNCRFETCGNGQVDTGEECDDANSVSGDGCTACSWDSCGNGVIDAGEECDTGGVNRNGDGSGCSARCTSFTCGNGIVEEGEECDDSGPHCHPTLCVLQECGDGRVTGAEQCDSTPNCDPACNLLLCGNGVVDAGEECDHNYEGLYSGCSNNCVLQTCGDGIVTGSEQCDDGNTVETDGCHDCSIRRADILIVGSTMADDQLELRAAWLAGYTAVVATDDELRTITEQELRGYKAIVFGDNDCLQTPPGILSEVPFVHNWQRAVYDGQVLLYNGAPGLENEVGATAGFIKYAASGAPGTTGLYYALSCYGQDALGVLSVMEHDRQGHWGLVSPHQRNKVHIVASDPAMSLMFEEDLDTWKVSSQGVFSEWPKTFVPLAICTDATEALITTTRTLTGESTVGGVHILGRSRPGLTRGATCGDGSVDANRGEQCDDGNNIGGDSCAENCIVEGCGNGQQESGEYCDDGNLIDGDGCSSTCGPDPCGDGYLDAGEECDDGNNINNDGCAANCTIQACNHDGIVDAGEECDDGNFIERDGCSNGCKTQFCGDQIIQDGEECDIGGPSSGWNFPIFDSPMGCTTCLLDKCGDLFVTPLLGEECDDGNLIPGDGCSPTCKLEHVTNNECLTNAEAANGCHPDAFCVDKRPFVDSVGDWYCSCKYGYYGDGKISCKGTCPANLTDVSLGRVDSACNCAALYSQPKLPWSDAQASCAAKGESWGYTGWELANAHRGSEFGNIANLRSNPNGPPAWIGARDYAIGPANDWRWGDGTDVMASEVVAWPGGSPWASPPNGPQLAMDDGCGSLYTSNAEWRRECSESNDYICCAPYVPDECRMFDPCVNGVCINGKEGLYCDCDKMWSGDHCDIPVRLDECEAVPAPCHADATCHDPNPTFLSVGDDLCTCNVGYHGDGVTTCDGPCPEGFIGLPAGSACPCVAQVGPPTPWSNAEATCQAKGPNVYLAVFGSALEVAAAAARVDLGTKDAWIGLSHASGAGWSHTDGTDASFMLGLQAGATDPARACAKLSGYSGQGPTWDGEDCNWSVVPLCCSAGPRPLDECAVNNGGCHANADCHDPVPTTVSPNDRVCTCKPGYVGDGVLRCDGFCPPGYEQTGGPCGCLRKWNTPRRTWADARADCVAQGGDLASAKTQGDWTQIALLHSSSGYETTWLGLTDQAAEGDWTWADGTALTFDAWGGCCEPNNAGGNEDCGSIAQNALVWNDLDCSHTRAYMCCVDDTAFVCGDGVVTPELNEECDDGNTQSGDGCSATCQFEPVVECEFNNGGCSVNAVCSDPNIFVRGDVICTCLQGFTGDGKVCIGVCPDGFVKTGDREPCSCVKRVTELATWHQAQANCRAEGLELASVTVRDEWMLLMTLYTGNTAWLGLHDQTNEGVWEWSDGSPVGFTNWLSPGEPNNFGTGEHCASIGSQTQYWNDLPCDRLHESYCCTAHVVNSCDPNPCPPEQPCLVTATGVGYRCDGACGNGVVESGAPHFEQCDPPVAGQCSSTCQLLPIDECALPSTNNCHSSATCVDPDTSPLSRNDFVCTCKPGYVGDGVLRCDGFCPPGYEQTGSPCGCLRKWNTPRRTWADARADCVAQGGNLASAKTQGDWSQITALHASTGYETTWLGLTDQAVEDSWTWADGTALTFDAWGGCCEPNNAGGNEDCGSIVQNALVWNDLDCSRTHAYMCCVDTAPLVCGDGVVTPELNEQCDDGNTQSGDGCSATCQFEPVDECQLNNGGCSANAACRDPNTNVRGDRVCTCLPGFRGNGEVCIGVCPDGFVKTGDREPCSCVKRVTEVATWHQAQANCRAEGLELASVSTFSEWSVLLALHSGNTAWLGLHDQTNEGVWEWSDGSAVGFTNWLTPGEPNNFGGNEHCASVRWQSPLWNDLPCDRAHESYCCTTQVADACFPNPCPSGHECRRTSSGAGYACVNLCGNGVIDAGEECDPPRFFTCSRTCQRRFRLWPRRFGNTVALRFVFPTPTTGLTASAFVVTSTDPSAAIAGTVTALAAPAPSGRTLTQISPTEYLLEVVLAPPLSDAEVTASLPAQSPGVSPPNEEMTAAQSYVAPTVDLSASVRPSGAFTYENTLVFVATFTGGVDAGTTGVTADLLVLDLTPSLPAHPMTTESVTMRQLTNMQYEWTVVLGSAPGSVRVSIPDSTGVVEPAHAASAPYTIDFGGRCADAECPAGRVPLGTDFGAGTVCSHASTGLCVGFSLDAETGAVAFPAACPEGAQICANVVTPPVDPADACADCAPGTSGPCKHQNDNTCLGWADAARRLCPTGTVACHIDPCLGVHCRHGGTCVPNDDGSGGFHCDCPALASGGTCEVHECGACAGVSACQHLNDGTCLDYYASTSICPAGTRSCVDPPNVECSCAGGTSGPCRNMANGVCYSQDALGNCPAGTAVCGLASTSSLDLPSGGQGVALLRIRTVGLEQQHLDGVTEAMVTTVAAMALVPEGQVQVLQVAPLEGAGDSCGYSGGCQVVFSVAVTARAPDAAAMEVARGVEAGTLTAGLGHGVIAPLVVGEVVAPPSGGADGDSTGPDNTGPDIGGSGGSSVGSVSEAESDVAGASGAGQETVGDAGSTTQQQEAAFTAPVLAAAAVAVVVVGIIVAVVARRRAGSHSSKAATVHVTAAAPVKVHTPTAPRRRSRRQRPQPAAERSGSPTGPGVPLPKSSDRAVVRTQSRSAWSVE